MVIACTDPQPRIDELNGRLDELAAKCTNLNTTISSLQSIAEALQQKQSLTTFTPVTDAAGKVVGYTLAFKDQGAVTVYNNPSYVTVGQQNGEYYWMVSGQFLKDAKGNLVPVVAEEQPAPQFKIEGNCLKMSLDGGATWTEAAEVSQPMFESITENANSIDIVMADGAKISIPKAAKLQVEFFAEKKAFEPNEVAYVQYKVSGAGEKAVNVETYASNGWKAEIFSTSDTEGYIKVVTPDDVTNPSVVVFVSTETGDVLVANLDLASASQAPDSPVLSALVDVVSVGCGSCEIEVKVSTNLDYEVTPDADWVVYKQTKAVREDVVTFEVKANQSEDARSSVITFKSGNYYTTCCVMQEADYGEIDNEPQTPVDPDLSKDGTANCYVVNAEGSYSFNASVIGNGAEGIIEGGRFHIDEDEIEIKPSEVTLEWCQNECIKDVKLNKSTSVITFTATGNKGNALISVADRYGEIIWSWHIWCTNMPKDVTHTNVFGKQFTMQDRNIGATSINPNEVTKTSGMFYQWGRKDPFIPSKDLKATMIKNPSNDIYGAVMNPTLPFKMSTNTFEWYNGVLSKIDHTLWGNPDYENVHPLTEYQKSIYDPCPVGYMVPPQDTWAGLSESDLQFVPAGFFQLLDGGKKVFFPYSGCCDQGNTDNKDCGYAGYYNYVPEGSRDKVWFCRLWTSATGLYQTKYMGGQQLLVQHDPEEGGNVVAGSTGDLRARMVPVRCMKIQK